MTDTGADVAVKESGWSLEAGKGKETDSLREPIEGTPPCQHFDVSSVRTILDF